MSLAQQFAQCCCDNKLLITQMGYEGQLRDLSNTQQLTSQLNVVNTGLERGFSSVAYGTAVKITMMKIMMIMMMIINVHLDILFKEVDIDKLYI